MAESKPIVVDVQGVVVVATRVPVECYEWRVVRVNNGVRAEQTEQQPKERSRYAITVDGVLRGHLVFPLGWGGSWEIYCLGRRAAHPGDVWRPCRVYHKWVAHSAQLKPLKSKEDALACIPAMIAEGGLPSRRELMTHEAELKVRDAQRAIEDAERRAKWDRERAERDARIAAQKEREAAEHAADLETLEGLLARRGPAGLSNVEVDLLERFAQQLRGKR